MFHKPRRLMVYLEQSESVKELNEAVVKAAMEFTPIARDTNCEKMVQGRKVKYRIASLNALRAATMPYLLKHGVLLHQDYCVSDEGVTLVTSLSLGDQYRRSTLPIRQYEDDDRQKAHMTKMRKAGYEAILCLASEEEDDVPQPAVEQPATAADQNGRAPFSAMAWKHQTIRAKDAVRDCKTVAEAEDILRKVKNKISIGDMDPHCIAELEELVIARIAALQKDSAKNPGESRKAVVA